MSQALTTINEAAAKKWLDHGRHIFVYNNIRTNQVVYSLERSLKNNVAINQLAFAGKNLVPPSIRKDVWRPLLTVSFPSVPQGLDAYRKLREYRRLHELSWDTEEARKKEQEMVDHPSNKDNKKEREEDDMLVREGGRRLRNSFFKKAKSKIIMNQKANTIADLAAVLQEQEQLGAKVTEAVRSTKEAENKSTREEVIQLSKEKDEGGLETLDAEIQPLESQISALRTPEASKEQKRERHALERKRRELTVRREKMTIAAAAIAKAKDDALSQAESRQKGGRLQSGESSVDVELDLQSIFQAFKQLDATSAKTDNVPKRGKFSKEVAAQKAPVYTTEGVRIRWADLLDAEYAESWPRAVDHNVLGLTRYTAPAAEKKPISDLRTWRILQSPWGHLLSPEGELPVPVEKPRKRRDLHKGPTGYHAFYESVTEAE